MKKTANRKGRKGRDLNLCLKIKNIREQSRDESIMQSQTNAAFQQAKNKIITSASADPNNFKQTAKNSIKIKIRFKGEASCKTDLLEKTKPKKSSPG